jgi:hypothetical protein
MNSPSWCPLSGEPVPASFPDINQKPWVMAQRISEFEVQTDGSWKPISETKPTNRYWPDFASFVESLMSLPGGKGFLQ